MKKNPGWGFFEHIEIWYVMLCSGIIPVASGAPVASVRPGYLEITVFTLLEVTW